MLLYHRITRLMVMMHLVYQALTNSYKQIIPADKQVLEIILQTVKCSVTLMQLLIQLSQSNFVADADDGTVVSQDNGLVISQALDLENDCDENTFTDTHDNNANCLQDEFIR